MATRHYNIPINQEVSKRYASDLNDQEFALLAPHVAQNDGSGKKRTVDIRFRADNQCGYYCIASCGSMACTPQT